jgi:CRP/FNR family transcriptional regulator, cyclic AMP receptor protein
VLGALIQEVGPNIYQCDGTNSLGSDFAPLMIKGRNDWHITPNLLRVSDQQLISVAAHRQGKTGHYEARRRFMTPLMPTWYKSCMAKKASRSRRAFDLVEYLATAGVSRKVVKYRKGQAIFSQGEAATSVLYLQTGSVKITVNSSTGKEAVIALLHPSDFFGEASIAGQRLRFATATAVEPTLVLEIEKREMIRVVHEEHKFSDRFVAYMLKRNIRIEEDLTDQLFNPSEKRLARALWLIARYGNEEKHDTIVAKVSQETLAEMIGTTRGRVSQFMNKFRKLGYIKYNGGLQVHDSLLRVILHD